MGAIVLVVGVIALGAVIAAVVVFVKIRGGRTSRTGSVNLGAGPYPPQTGYPPAQPPYPSTPQQGYPVPPAQPPHPQAPNPYTQQPPHQGQ